MGKPFTEEERALIKNQIVTYAFEQFSKSSYKMVKIEAIAAGVGIGKGTMYRFYPSKETLFIDVMMAYEKAIQKQIFIRTATCIDNKEKIKLSILTALKQTEDNQIFQAISDPELMSKLMAVLSPEQVEAMAQTDLVFIDQLLDTGVILKVKKEIAVDLLRGVFYLRLYNQQLLSDPDEFMSCYIDAVIEKIL